MNNNKSNNNKTTKKRRICCILICLIVCIPLRFDIEKGLLDVGKLDKMYAAM